VSISSTKCRDPQSTFEVGARYQALHTILLQPARNMHRVDQLSKSVLEEDSVVGAPSIDKTVTVRPERRESLNLKYFIPVFICSLPYGAYELGGPSRQYRHCRTNETEHSSPSKFPEKDCEYHEDTLPRGKERDRDMNYNHSPDQRYFYCAYCLSEMKGE
jgi:hypothetical protein